MHVFTYKILQAIQVSFETIFTNVYLMKVSYALTF